MEELIYKFLLQSNYSRASIISDIRTVKHSASPSDASFVIIDPAIIDPENIDCLAVIKVVGPVNADGLIDQAALISGLAQSIGEQQTQGFVIRVDTRAKSDAEQVQFYRCHPTSDLQQINARTFPDFDSLKVHHKLMAKKRVNTASQAVELGEEPHTDAPPSVKAAMVPALLIVLIVIIDWLVERFSGAALLQLTHALLLLGAAVLLSIPAFLRYAIDFIRR